MQLSAILLCLLAPSVLAGPRSLYVTEFGRQVLRRSDQVVEGEVAKIFPAFRGVTTARVKVAKSWMGFDRDRDLRLMFIEDYVAPEAFTATLDRYKVSNVKERKTDRGLLGGVREREEVTGERKVSKKHQEAPGVGTPNHGVGIQLIEGEQGLFFLRRRGGSYGIIGVVSIRDPLFTIKKEQLKEVVAIEAEASFEGKFQRAKRFYFAGMEHTNRWVRGNSARELMSLATRFPKLFGETDARRLATLRLEEKSGTIRAALARAIRAVDPELGIQIEMEAEQAETARFARQMELEGRVLAKLKDPDIRSVQILRVGQAYHRGATRVMAAYLADPVASVREVAAAALAEYGGPSARPALRKALENEKTVPAAKQMIHACAVMNDEAAVPFIATRLQTLELERAAVMALARIGTEEARQALIEHRARAVPGTRSLIDTLLREEFPRGT
jgi:hypothetical protein